MEPSLPVVECFHSLQGEGAHAGRSAYFIRLASCKVGCSWCDTKESWNSAVHPLQNVVELSFNTTKAQKEGAGFVVITGGEPLHHDLNQLCKEIRKSTLDDQNNSIPIHLETSGVDPLSGNPDWITLSPKRHFPPRSDILFSCQELKPLLTYQQGLDVNFNPTHLFYTASFIKQKEFFPSLKEIECIEWIPLPQCIEMITSGEIIDCFTIIALLAYKLHVKSNH